MGRDLEMKKNVFIGLFALFGLGMLALEIGAKREAIFGQDANAFAASVMPDFKRSDSPSPAITPVQAAKYSSRLREAKRSAMGVRR